MSISRIRIWMLMGTPSGIVFPGKETVISRKSSTICRIEGTPGTTASNPTWKWYFTMTRPRVPRLVGLPISSHTANASKRCSHPMKETGHKRNPHMPPRKVSVPTRAYGARAGLQLQVLPICCPTCSSRYGRWRKVKPWHGMPPLVE